MRAEIPKPRQPKTAAWVIGASLGMATLAAILLFLFDPARSPIYPVCHFHQWTGWHCPGCGSLRALHHLTHGELATAFKSNPLLIAALPLLGLWVLWRWFRRRDYSSLFPSLFNGVMPWIVLAVIVLFGILRNVPHPAFVWMSP